MTGGANAGALIVGSTGRSEGVMGVVWRGQSHGRSVAASLEAVSAGATVIATQLARWEDLEGLARRASRRTRQGATARRRPPVENSDFGRLSGTPR
jgi:hypothetical protein